ncbi:MAG: right-handed parallel beta-helix repeat-containing protein [Acidobacteriota bacterium]|nr:right-handed parallel beta-helix repeat-containing protein [Acidobacteriota bacterium]
MQTFRTNDALGDTARVGGEDPTKVDAAAGAAATTLASLTTATTTAQSIGSVPATLASVAGVDFGFNFDTIINTKDSGQGSLRQFITNANALAGADVSVFMISDGAAHPGLRAGLTNQLTSGVATITLASLLPAVTDANTTIDGTTQTVNVGNTNSGTLGAGGTVGVDRLTLSTVQRPEVQLIHGATVLAVGLDLQGTNEIVRGLAVYGFGTAANNDTSANIRLGASASNALIEQNILGSTAISFTDPGAGLRSTGDNVRSTGADNGILRNNLVGFSAGKGFGVEGGSTVWTIENNEFRGNGIGNSNLDGVDLETVGTTGNTVRGNLSADNEGVGVDSYQSGGSNTIVNNTITNNGIGTGANVETAGIRLYGTNNTVDRNIIYANYGAGVMVTSNASANTITRNSIYANGMILNKGGSAASGQIGIDLQSATDNASTGTAPFVTINDNGDTDVGGNGLLNFPVLESAQISGGNLVIKGFARPGSIVEFFVAAPDASGFGEGQTYLFTFTEGSAQDADAGTGTYTSPFGGKTVGTDTTNRFAFSAALPSGVSTGTILTATATLAASTSEFSNNVSVANAPPAVGLVKSVTPTGTQLPGTELTYTITFTNSGGQVATNFLLTDPDPANATLKLNKNTDFKIGSVANSLGTTGLTATVSFSNDNGVSYTYTPVSQGGGAPAGFDRNVTHVRWTFSGTLSQTAPNNTGSISFVVRIR